MSIQSRSSLGKQCCFSFLVLCAAFVGGCSAASESPDAADEERASSAGSSGLAGGTAIGGAGTFGGAPGSAGVAAFGGSTQAASAGAPAAGSGGAFFGTAGASGAFTGGAGAGGAFSAGAGAGGATAGSGSGGGMSGHAGQSSGGSGGIGGGTAPTWTQLYNQFFNNMQYSSNCTGSQCHNPGRQKSIDFSTQAKGYASVKASLSKVSSVLSSGSMPAGRPRMPTADLNMFKAWVAAGALNN